MEVHHHIPTSHSAAGGTGKKWTHYLWEFLMLFLAVFCGFLAENIREQQVEKEKGKQYVRSFYDDLHLNLVVFSKIIEFNNQKTDGLNNMSSCYDSLLKNWKSS